MRASSFVAREILKSGWDDWVPLLEIEGFASRAGAKTREEVGDLMLASIELLANSGLVELGRIEEGKGFVPWVEPLDEALDRLRGILDLPERNDRDFAMWLANTPEGDVKGEQYLREDGQINENYGKPREG